MDKLKLEIDLPDSLYEKLGAFITKKVDEAFTARAQAIQKERVKYTRAEAAKMLRVSLPTLDSYSKQGILKPQTIGRRVLFPADQIENFLNRRK